jgi:hypothetical protein
MVCSFEVSLDRADALIEGGQEAAYARKIFRIVLSRQILRSIGRKVRQ